MPRENEKPLVVLIHGIASGRATIWPLAWWIRRAGFRTRCYGYSSCFKDLQHHGEEFHKFLKGVGQRESPTGVHIVAHSMGGIVTRRALTLADNNIDFVRRVIMLGTPQKGSPNARWLSNSGLGFIRPLRQLSDVPDSFVNRLPTISGTEIGTIAASYDFVISRESSRVVGESDYVRPFSGHNGLLVRPKVAKLVVNFLNDGTFG